MIFKKNNYLTDWDKKNEKKELKGSIELWGYKFENVDKLKNVLTKEHKLLDVLKLVVKSIERDKLYLYVERKRRDKKVYFKMNKIYGEQQTIIFE